MKANKLVESYTNWLKDSVFSIEIDENYTEIVTPFLDSHNDLISVYVKSLDNDRLFLTDGGDTIGLLDAYGVDVASKDAYILLERDLRAQQVVKLKTRKSVLSREKVMLVFL